MHFDLDAPLETSTQVKAFVGGLGVELCAVTACATLEQKAAPADRPGRLSPRFRSAVVLGKAIYLGLSSARHNQMRQFVNGRLKKRLEDLAGVLADALERAGHASVALPALAMDHARQGFEQLLPMAQGTALARLAAVEAGLASWGLNDMVLTPRFGPRVFLSLVLTELELEPDAPLDGELCLGLEACGRCAVACPTGAIPKKAPAGASLHAVRGLDKPACATACQPVASGAFVGFLRDLAQDPDPQRRLKHVRGWRSGEIWQQVSMFKPGALTGCMRCAQVCPVGQDYEALSQAPDFEDVAVAHTRASDGAVEVGPA